MDRPRGLPPVDSAGGKIGPATGRTVSIADLRGPRDVAMTVRVGTGLRVGSAAMRRPMEIGGTDPRVDHAGLMDRRAGLTDPQVDLAVSTDRHADLTDLQVGPAGTDPQVHRVVSMGRHAGLTDLQVDRAGMDLRVDFESLMDHRAGLGQADSIKVGARRSAVVSAP